MTQRGARQFILLNVNALKCIKTRRLTLTRQNALYSKYMFDVPRQEILNGKIKLDPTEGSKMTLL